MARPERRFLPLLLVFVFLSGCSVWDSVTSYFNTFYNARRLFQEAEEELWAQADTRFTGRDVLAPMNVGQGARVKFTSVIEKCSKLLQYYPESGLVDDALLMIGKSYLYQSEYQRAERKFKELLDQYPDSDFALEARFLLAASYYKMGDLPSARQTAQDVLGRARTEERDEIIGDVSALLGKLDLEAKNNEAAREGFLAAAEESGNADRRASAYLVVASLDSAAGRFGPAEQAYRRAGEEGSSYVFEYRGRMGEARMAAAQGRYVESLDRLEDLRSNSNFREHFGQIELQTGIVHQDAGDIQAAMESYRYVDTAYARTVVAAEALFRLGMIFEHRMLDYDSARVTFNRARNVAPAAPVSKEIVRRADYLNRYAQLRGEIARYDSLLAVFLLLPDTAAKQRPGTTEEKPDSSARDTLLMVSRPDHGLPDSLAEGSPDSLAEGSPDSLAEGLPDSLSQRLRDSSPRRPPDSAAAHGRDSVRIIPQITIPRDSVESRLAYAMNELATMFFTTIQRPDSAARWYDRLLSTFPSSRVAPRAMYGYAQVLARDSTVRPEVPDSLYRTLVSRHPDSEFAAESRRILGLPAVESAVDEAEHLYRQAEQQLLSGHSENAVSIFRSIVRKYPESGVASRAQFAAAYVYGGQLSRRDSAIVLYRRLVERYPDSPLAGRVRPLILELDRAAAQARASAADTTKGAVADSTRSTAADSVVVPGQPPETPGDPDVRPERESPRRRGPPEKPSRLPQEEEPKKEGTLPPRPE